MENPLPLKNVTFQSGYIEVEEQVSLRYFQWIPDDNKEKEPILFIAGFVSVIQGWLPVLEELIKHRPVFYLESREKGSANISKAALTPADFSIPKMAMDIVVAASKLNIAGDTLIVSGSSLGGTSLLEALKKSRLVAAGAFLIGPNAEFKGPWIVRSLTYLPAWLYHIVKYFILWYLKTFRVDAEKEPEQMKRYRDTLLTAHPLRLKLSARYAMDFEIWPEIETITRPCAIAYAPSDTLHSDANIHKMHETIPDSRLVTCPSNKYMHDARIVPDIESFIRKIKESHS